MERLERLADAYRIEHGKRFRLRDQDPGYTGNFESMEHAIVALQEGIAQLVDLQDKLYAQNRWAVLLLFQGVDAAGKDSAIKHVMSGANPQGCAVHSFKAPSEEDLNHDYMWRTTKHLPERGQIGIFSRSYYEEVLVVRVHPHLLRSEKIPPSLITRKIWKKRFEGIRGFERYLSRNGTVVRKFFLNLSKEEQTKRFLARLERPEKNWKFSMADLFAREHWDEYMDTYKDMIRNTAAAAAPWYVVPADHKWFSRLVVATAIVDILKELKVSYPKVDAGRRRELQEARCLIESRQA